MWDLLPISIFINHLLYVGYSFSQYKTKVLQIGTWRKWKGLVDYVLVSIVYDILIINFLNSTNDAFN